MVSGCSLKEIQHQTEIVENFGSISGEVEITSTQKGPVHALLFTNDNGVPVFFSSRTVPGTGKFEFISTPGEYYVAAFIDKNNDGAYQPEEHGNYHGSPTTITIIAKNETIIEPIKISSTFPQYENQIQPLSKTLAAWTNTGKVVSLNDPRFTRDNYNMGFWKPFDFLEVAEGGLFFLEDYQKGKMPVLFIHGVMGGPTDWEVVLQGLDKDTFQPWIVYYPSGLRLDMVSNYMVEVMTRLQNKHGFSDFTVIAHSMGGLLARSFVKKYIEHSPGNDKKLKLVMTVNSPMGGMSAAGSGVKNSPIVVPSWRDVEPESDFLKDLHAWNWPQNIPYHLFISYVDGKSGDGVVPLQSQSALKLQSEARKVYVFNDNHVGILHDQKFITQMNDILMTIAK